MTESHAEAGSWPPVGPLSGLDPILLNDWITIWHSEFAAAITDREAQETMLRLIDLWAVEARRAVAAVEPHARPAPPPRTPPPAAAPDERDAVIADLRAQLAELERRLANPA